MAAALSASVSFPGASIPVGEYMSVTDVSALAGIRKQAVYQAIGRGTLHPMRLPWLSYRVFFRSEILAWRQRFQWRPTPQELEVLVSAGYQAKDFTPAPVVTVTEAGATGAPLASPADLAAFVQVVMREGQALTASAAAVASEATQGAMRPWAENVRAGVQAPPDMADVGDVASKVAQGVVFPITDAIRATIAPIGESLAQAVQVRPAPAADEVTRYLGALRVEVAAMMARMLEAFRPMVERLIAREPVTPEDATPFMQLMNEIADALAGSPFQEMARQAIAQVPATLAEMNTLRQAQAQAQAQTPAPASDTVTSETPAGASPSSSKRSTR